MKELLFLPLTNDTIFDGLRHLVSPSKHEYLNSFHFDIDKKLSLYAELLVRIFACKQLSVRNEQLLFRKNEYGKPYLLSYPNFHFNISHTHNAIAVAVSNAENGVDIEHLRKFELKVAKRFFTSNESAYIGTGNYLERFFEIWTKKEAYAKCLGKGLAIPLRSFDVLEKPNLFHFLRIDKYFISMFQQEESQQVQIRQWTEDALVREALHLQHFCT